MFVWLLPVVGSSFVVREGAPPPVTDVPEGFECAWRSAAYEFGQTLVPRLGAFDALYDALELDNCSTVRTRSVPPVKHRRKHPKDAVYVAPGTADEEHGSRRRPFRSLQRACDAAVATTSKTVVLTEGVYEEGIVLTSQHNGLMMVGENATMSGGVETSDLDWTFDGTYYSTPFDLAALNLTEVPGLQANGKRLTRARFPNLPGGIEETCYYGCVVAGDNATWTPPLSYPDPDYYTGTMTRNDTVNGYFQQYELGVGGSCSVFDPPSSYWCNESPSGGGAFQFMIPSGVTLPDGMGPYKKPPKFHVYRPARWANWMFEAVGDNPYNFTKGGFQGARGDDTGGDFFVEDVFEELDHELEFFFDEDAATLYVMSDPPAAVVVPKLRTLVNVSGTQWDPVKDVTIENVNFRSTRYTYMDPHGVPSGGDWSLERAGTVFVQGAENFLLRDCTFDRTDNGNGVMVSGYNRNTTILDTDFSFMGGSAVALWGYTNETATDPGRPGVMLENYPQAGQDGSDGEHPVGTVIRGCTAHDIGLYAKQTSFFFQAKSANTTLAGNVFFNAPRAGINLNDGFAGGDTLERNLVFNAVRETQDHGTFNSWDRQPYFVSNPTLETATRTITGNFFVDNYNMQEAVDNDDGSGYYHTTGNFLVYGKNGMKNDFGGHDNHHDNNLYAYVDKSLGVTQTLPGHGDSFTDNTVLLNNLDVGSPVCTGDEPTVLARNTYLTSNGSVTECGMSLADWQAIGNDPNSTVGVLPDDPDTVIQWAKALLNF